MKFIFTENLEDELIEQEAIKSEIIKELIDLFDELNFSRKVTINGINFENKNDDIYASFYIDNYINYKGYVTNDKDDSMNYSIKGNIKNVISAANSLIDIYYQTLEDLKSEED